MSMSPIQFLISVVMGVVLLLPSFVHAVAPPPVAEGGAAQLVVVDMQGIVAIVTLFKSLGIIPPSKHARVDAFLEEWGRNKKIYDPKLSYATTPQAQKTSITIVAPNGGESYVVGVEPIQVTARVSGAEQGAMVCAVLIRLYDSKYFSFPSSGNCFPVIDGIVSFVGTLERTTGYDLGPGAYSLQLTLHNSSNGPHAAPPLGWQPTSDTSDGYILLIEVDGTVAPDLSYERVVYTSMTSRVDDKVISIALVSPTPGAVVRVGAPVLIRWNIPHMPAQSRVVYSVSLVRGVGGGGSVAGSMWQNTLTPDLDYNIMHTGYGHLDRTGIYEVVAFIESCGAVCATAMPGAYPVLARSDTIRFVLLPAIQ